MFAGGIRSMLMGTTYAGPRQPGCAGGTMTMFPQAVKLALEERNVAALLAWIPGRSSARDLPLDDPPLARAYLRSFTKPAFATVKRVLLRFGFKREK
jgi:hypothetical protein